MVQKCMEQMTTECRSYKLSGAWDYIIIRICKSVTGCESCFSMYNIAINILKRLHNHSTAATNNDFQLNCWSSSQQVY